MTTRVHTGSLVILLLRLATCPSYGYDDSIFVGSLIELKGAMGLVRPGGYVTLDEKTNFIRWQPVHDKEVLINTNGATVKILLRSGKLYSVTEDMTKVSVSSALEDRPAFTTHKAVAEGLQRAGANMADNIVFQPRQDGAVVSTNTLIRWIPGHRGELVDLKIANWSSLQNSDDGYLEDARLAETLQRKRLPLVLEFKRGKTISSVRFSVVSESKVKQELETLENELGHLPESDLKNEMRHLAIAATYNRLKLFNDAAAIYDKLLSLPSARSNMNLIALAAGMHAKIGNKERVLALEKVLTTGSK